MLRPTNDLIGPITSSETSDALSPDDAGAATIAAALLPPRLDLDDEIAVFLHLHAQGMPWRDIQKLAPFIIAKAREQRAFLERAPTSDGARDFVSGVSP